MNYMILPGLRKINLQQLSEDERRKHFTIEAKEVAKTFGVSYDEMMQKTRKRQCVMPRQVCMAMFVKKHKVTYRESGAFFGLDHATAVHACKTVEDLRQFDKQFKKLSDKFLADESKKRNKSR